MAESIWQFAGYADLMHHTNMPCGNMFALHTNDKPTLFLRIILTLKGKKPTMILLWYEGQHSVHSLYFNG